MEIDHNMLLKDGVEALETCFELQKSLCASAKGFSVLSIVVMEVSCLLAMFLISSISISMSDVQEEATHDIAKEIPHSRPYTLFLKGESTLERLALDSKVAEKCTQVLKPFHEKLKALLNGASQACMGRNLGASQAHSPASQPAFANTPTSAHFPQIIR
jgi:hypothetical protein